MGGERESGRLKERARGERERDRGRESERHRERRRERERQHENEMLTSHNSRSARLTEQISDCLKYLLFH